MNSFMMRIEDACQMNSIFNHHHGMISMKISRSWTLSTRTCRWNELKIGNKCERMFTNVIVFRQKESILVSWTVIYSELSSSSHICSCLSVYRSILTCIRLLSTKMVRLSIRLVVKNKISHGDFNATAVIQLEGDNKMLPSLTINGSNLSSKSIGFDLVQSRTYLRVSTNNLFIDRLLHR